MEAGKLAIKTPISNQGSAAATVPANHIPGISKQRGNARQTESFEDATSKSHLSSKCSAWQENQDAYFDSHASMHTTMQCVIPCVWNIAYLQTIHILHATCYNACYKQEIAHNTDTLSHAFSSKQNFARCTRFPQSAGVIFHLRTRRTHTTSKQHRLTPTLILIALFNFVLTTSIGMSVSTSNSHETCKRHIKV